MLDEILKSTTVEPKVVIVDDYYGEPDFSLIDSEALSNLFHALKGKTARLKTLAAALQLKKTPPLKDLMSWIEKNPSPLWKLYRSGTAEFEYLGELFGKVGASKDADKPALDLINRYFLETLQIEPLKFANLSSASKALSECVIAFVDFRLAPHMSVEKALEAHKEHRQFYSGKFTYEAKPCPKIVYLISSALPNTVQLQKFRTDTGLRTAFFHAFKKSDVTQELLASQLQRWNSRYSPAAELETYLAAVSQSIKNSADEMLKLVDGLELHDLGMLEVFRLSVEAQSLQSYLNWLVAEALSSGVINDPALQPALLPKDPPFTSVDGKLKLEPRLFDLFASISMVPASEQASGPELGDIFVVVTPADQRPRIAFLVISPACDLARCSDEYQVLCVGGKENAAQNDTDLLTSGDGLFSKSRNLIRYAYGEAKQRYAVIGWDSKALQTIPAKDLRDRAKYKCIARLSELRTLEVKSDALSSTSRIGVQTYPSLAVPAQSFIRLRFGSAGWEVDSNSLPFQCAVVVRGRATGKDNRNDALHVVFTEQFVEWMRKEFLPAAKAKFGERKFAKFDAIEAKFMSSENLSVTLKDGKPQAAHLHDACRVVLIESADRVQTLTTDGVEISIVIDRATTGDSSAPAGGR